MALVKIQIGMPCECYAMRCSHTFIYHMRRLLVRNQLVTQETNISTRGLPVM